MTGIIGKFTVTFDPKSGRLSIPARHRKAIPEKQRDELYLTRGFDRCVTGYYKDSWDEFKNKITDKSLPLKDRYALKREFIGRLSPATFDKQGRVTLSADLVKYANLENQDEAIVVGCEDCIEIWNPNDYEQESKNTDQIVSNLLNEGRL